MARCDEGDLLRSSGFTVRRGSRAVTVGNATDGPVVATIRRDHGAGTCIMGAEPVNMAVLDVPVWIMFFSV